MTRSIKKGFTLIELLIVISIIGILAVALLPNVLGAPATARDAGRKAQMNSIISALESYKAANGDYPAPATGCLPSTLADYFKGGDLPLGAPAKAATDAALGCGTNAAGADTKIAYCKLSTDTTGYSYVVAIRMENKMNGSAEQNNTLKPAAAATPEIGVATCPTAYSYAAVNATAAESSYWYYMVQ